jgi:5'-AMP-activated protein kinase regulatory beta subunit
MAPASGQSPAPQKERVKINDLPTVAEPRSLPGPEAVNPYFPSSPAKPTKAPVYTVPAPRRVTESQSDYSTPHTEVPDDGMVDVPIQWSGGGKTVLVTGNFADNWAGRIKLKKR